jgi:hypothetical protein
MRLAMSSDRFSGNWHKFVPAAVVCAGMLFCGGLAASAQQRTVVMRPPVVVQQPRQAVRVMQIPQGAHVVTNPVGAHTANRLHLQARPAERATGDHRGDGNRNFACANGLSLQQLLTPYPTNGLDFQYLNAIDSDLAIKAAIDPATELALNEARRLNCGSIGSGGYVLFGGGYGETQEVVQDEADDSDSGSGAKPQVIVVQVPAQSVGDSKPAAAPPEEQAPLPDVGPFVLVMRDGSQVQATAFTRSADQIIYIAPDGLRHVVPVTNIDADATTRLNSEHGSQIQLSL